MGVWVDRLGAALLDASASATILFFLVALTCLACRQPARRIVLARAALACSLVLPALSALAPLPRIHLLDALRWPAIVPQPPISPSDSLRVPESPRRSARSPWTRRRLGRVLTLGYFGGLGIGLAWMGLGWWGLGWLRRRSRAPSGEAEALYATLDWRSWRRRPRFRISDRVRRPVLIGTIHPAILVPAELDGPETIGELRLGLLHELAHAEAGDPWMTLMSGLAQSVWFFLPPVWWLGAQLRLDQEFLADRHAAPVGPTERYAHSLVDLAAARPVPGAPAAHRPQSAAGGSSLFPRVLMLVHCPFPVESRPPLGWSWALPMLVLLATVGTSRLCWHESSPASAQRPKPSCGSFQLARLVLPAKPANAHGRAPLFELPLRLPPRFELSVAVWGNLVALNQTRVAGHRLTLPTPGDPSEAPAWHHVRLRRDDQGVALWLDDHPLAPDPEPTTTTTWLSVEAPPDCPARFQNLRLNW